MERGRVRDGLLLPGPSSGLERQCGDVEELGQFKKRSAPDGRVVGQRLREVPGGSGHDQEVVVARAPLPDARIVRPQEAVEIEAVLGAGVDVAAVEVAEGVEAGVVGEEDGVGEIRVGGLAGELQDAAVEDELQREGVGAEPAAGAVVGGLPEAVVGQVRAEVVEEGVVGARGEEVQVEPRRQAADVDPAARAAVAGGGRTGRAKNGDEEGEEEEGGGDGGGHVEGRQQVRSGRTSSLTRTHSPHRGLVRSSSKSLPFSLPLSPLSLSTVASLFCSFFNCRWRNRRMMTMDSVKTGLKMRRLFLAS